jgi:rhodanese-related sulfurtransferase
VRTRRFASVTVAALVALTGAACTASEPAAGGRATASAEASRAYGATLNAAEFAASLDRPGVIVLDVRTPAEYAAGHLEGAVLADINGDFEAAVAGLDRAAPYAVYCRSGSRSGAAIEAMKQLGFGDAWHLGGGIGAWQAAGEDVVTGG